MEALVSRNRQTFFQIYFYLNSQLCYLMPVPGHTAVQRDFWRPVDFRFNLSCSFSGSKDKALHEFWYPKY